MLALVTERLHPAVVARVEALIAVSDDDEENLLGLIKAAPGNVSLVAGWRARAAGRVAHLRSINFLMTTDLLSSYI